MSFHLYVAGPMSGYPELNFPAFDNAAKALRLAGYDVFNPADHDRYFEKRHGRSVTAREALQVDTKWICERADGLAMLPGWEYSPGAQAEYHLALALGLLVKGWEDWLIEPDSYICSPRQTA